MAVTTLKLPDQLKVRVAKVAESAGQSMHAFMVDAIEQQTRLAEVRGQLIEDALLAEAEALRTGVGYSAADVHAYIQGLAQGKKVARPKARRWPR
jgi:predicted transcriptional regulator